MWQHFSNINKTIITVFIHVFYHVVNYIQSGTHSTCVFSPGYYTHVSTLADVQENVMEYLHVLSRPMVINHDHDIIWTEAYMDSVVSVSVKLLFQCLSLFLFFFVKQDCPAVDGPSLHTDFN